MVCEDRTATTNSTRNSEAGKGWSAHISQRLTKTMTDKPHRHRCTGKTKSGKPCRAAATAGGLCFFHANPAKAAELGRAGGRRNRHVPNENVDPLPTLNTALAVRETVARLIADVYAGKIHPRIATSLATLLNLQLRAIETTDLARRVAELERQLTHAQGEADLEGSRDAGEGAGGTTEDQTAT